MNKYSVNTFEASSCLDSWSVRLLYRLLVICLLACLLACVFYINRVDQGIKEGRHKTKRVALSNRVAQKDKKLVE